MLKSICELSYIDKVFVMPDKTPPHKHFDCIVDDYHRQEMCSIVCKDFDKAEPCFIEFNREGKSYTIDTIKLLKEMYNDDNFYIVIGGDMLSTLDTWYEWQELIKHATFIAFKREGLADFDNAYDRLVSSGAKIIALQIPITDVSSTHLRNKIDKDLLPEKVYKYIVQKGIYNVR